MIMQIIPGMFNLLTKHKDAVCYALECIKAMEPYSLVIGELSC